MDKWLTNEFLHDGVSENSIKNYIRDVKILGGIKTIKNFDYLKDLETVRPRLLKSMDGKKDCTDNTIKNRLTAVLSVARILGPLGDDINKIYKPLHESYSNKLKAIELSGEKNTKQKEYYMTKDEIDTITATLKEKNNTHKKRMNYIIWLLYTAITPRRNLDYWLMNIIDDDIDYKTLPTERNYFMVKQKLFVFNQHKNTRWTEQKGIVETIDLEKSPEVYQSLLDYINTIYYHKRLKEHPLLCLKNGARLNDAAYISEQLQIITGKKHFGTNALRHIIAEHNAPSREKLDDLMLSAKESGHDLRTHMTIYIKKTTY